MAITRFKVATLPHVILYALTPLAVVALFIRAATYNSNLPWPVFATMAAVSTAWCSICALLWVARWRWAKSISFYSREGVAVRLGSRDNSWWMDVDRAITDTLAFWSRRYPEKRAAIADEFNGCVLSFFDTEYVVIRAYGWAERKAVGVTDYKVIAVRWRKVDKWSSVGALIRHEFSHCALNAVGIVNEDSSHRLMKEAGFGND